MAKLIATAGYVRVSHDEQKKHGFSIEAQIEGLEKYAKEKGYRIVEWYIDEGKSARKNHNFRKEYMRLINDAKEGKFKLIIFKCIDRWFRNISEYYKTQSILDDKGVDWECSEEEFDTTTREGRLKLNLYLMLAQDEADKTSERINYVFAHKIQNKEAITGSQPYGFNVKKIDGFKRVIKDPQVAPIIEDIITRFELYNSKRATLYYVQDKYNIKIEYNSITKVLRNTMLYGHYKGVDDYVWDGGYITKKRFDKIQNMMKKNIKERKNNHVHIFSGLLKCSNCDKNLIGKITTRTINKAGEKRSYIYYRCDNYAIKRQCTSKGNISEMSIENKLLSSIEEEIEKYICEYELSVKKKPKPTEDTIKEIKEDMQRVNVMFEKKRITIEEYDYKYERLEKKLEAATKEQPQERDLQPLHDFLNSGWVNVYSTLSKAEKRALWRSVIDNMIVELDSKEFTINFI